MTIDILPSWGRPGTPLLPATLRELWKAEAMPLWMANDLHLQTPAMLGQLDSSVPAGRSTIPDRVKRALSILLHRRQSEVASVRCINRPWPLGFSADSVCWTVRTRNALERSGLISSKGVNDATTFGDIFRVPGAGASTALDFAATLEAAMDEFERVANRAISAVAREPHGETSASASLGQLMNEPWAAAVGGSDPRFPELKRVTQGSLSDFAQNALEEPASAENARSIEYLFNCLPAVTAKIKSITEALLEPMLRQLLESAVRMEQKRVTAMSDRLGWSGKAPKTLEEVGASLGVTRERVRQLESKILKALPKEHPILAPALDRALASLRQAAPLAVSEAASLLKEQRISKQPFQPQAVIAIADQFGREHGLAIETVRGKPFVVSAGAEQPIRIMSRLVRRLSGMSGAFSVYQLQRECRKESARFEADKLRELLPTIPSLVKLDDEGDWWRMKGIPIYRDRLLILVMKMLSVASPMSIRTIREGVSRVYRWRSSTTERYRDNLIVPPLSVIQTILRETGRFEVGDEVSSNEPLDYKDHVGDAERILVEVLRSSATGVLDRSTLARQCMARGMNEATFGVLTSYSPLIEHPAIGVWKLRGVRVDPAVVEAARLAYKATPREKRILNYGWTKDGKLWIAARAPEFTRSMVVGIPGPFNSMLSGKAFAAFLPDGLSCGSITSADREGASATLWGFGPFVRMVALEEGDVMKMTFDLQLQRVVLETTDESSLDD